MSSVPPARSMRVGADASMCTRRHYTLACAVDAPIVVRGDLARGHVGPAGDRRLRRASTRSPATIRDRLAREFDLGGVIFFARNVDAPEQVAELSREAQALARELPAVGQRRPGRRARRAAEARRSPTGRRWRRSGRSGDEKLARGLRRALAARAEGGRHHARLHAGARRPHQPDESGHRRSRAGRARRRCRAARRGDHPRLQGAGHRRLRQALSRARRYEHRFASSSCR